MITLNKLEHQYISTNIDLIKSLIIKSEHNAVLLNNYINAKYIESTGYVERTYGLVVHSEDMTQWKYYMNLNGEYHFDDLETLGGMPLITSLDTKELIEYKKEILIDHPITLLEYKRKNKLFNDISAKLNNPLLANGVINPIDYSISLNSDDWSILGYDNSLIETQESSVIIRLQSFINDFTDRWFMDQFQDTDPLFMASFFSLLLSNLVTELLNIRTRNEGTDETHSFFLEQYLASHQGLDKFIPYLTFKQKMFLYRNIRYIERNAGSVYIFKKLLSRILTERNIPLSEYNIRQLSNMNMDKTIKNKITRNNINYLNNNELLSDLTLTNLNTSLKQEDNDNAFWLSANENQEIIKTNNLSNNTVKTKILESSMIDFSNNMNIKLFTVAFKEWCSLSNKGIYNPVIGFIDPVSNDLKSLNAKDCFIYFMYLLNYLCGYDGNMALPYFNYRSRKVSLPGLTGLTKYDRNKSDKFIEISKRLLNEMPVLNNLALVSNFYDYSTKLYDYEINVWAIISNINNIDTFTDIKYAIADFYESEVIDFNISDMMKWRKDRGLSIANYDENSIEKLLTNIYVAATGLNITSGSIVTQNQRALIELFKQLSSYSIKIINDNNTNMLFNLNKTRDRIGIKDNKTECEINVDAIRFIPLSEHTINSFMDNIYKNDKPIIAGNIKEINLDMKYSGKISNANDLTFEIPVRQRLLDITATVDAASDFIYGREQINAAIRNGSLNV